MNEAKINKRIQNTTGRQIAISILQQYVAIASSAQIILSHIAYFAYSYSYLLTAIKFRVPCFLYLPTLMSYMC